MEQCGIKVGVEKEGGEIFMCSGREFQHFSRGEAHVGTEKGS